MAPRSNRHAHAHALLLACASTALVVGCPSKPSKQEGGVVAAPPGVASASEGTPRVKLDVIAVRGSASGGASLEVATKVSYTPKRCDPGQYLPTPDDAGSRRRMTIFRVKDVSLASAGTTVVATQGAESSDDVWPGEAGERAVVIDCVDGSPDARPFPFFFTFAAPAGFDVKRAMLVLEGAQVPVGAFVKEE